MRVIKKKGSINESLYVLIVLVLLMIVVVNVDQKITGFAINDKEDLSLTYLHSSSQGTTMQVVNNDKYPVTITKIVINYEVFLSKQTTIKKDETKQFSYKHNICTSKKSIIVLVKYNNKIGVSKEMKKTIPTKEVC